MIGVLGQDNIFRNGYYGIWYSMERARNNLGIWLVFLFSCFNALKANKNPAPVALYLFRS